MILLGADHGGVGLKDAIKNYLEQNHIACKDFGTFDTESVDYVPIASKVAHGVANGEGEFGILCCGTGIGMSMAANKVQGVRAAVCSDPYCVEMTRAITTQMSSVWGDGDRRAKGGRVCKDFPVDRI